MTADGQARTVRGQSPDGHPSPIGGVRVSVVRPVGTRVRLMDRSSVLSMGAREARAEHGAFAAASGASAERSRPQLGAANRVLLGRRALTALSTVREGKCVAVSWLSRQAVEREQEGER